MIKSKKGRGRVTPQFYNEGYFFQLILQLSKYNHIQLDYRKMGFY
jgi:hypothetical protein